MKSISNNNIYERLEILQTTASGTFLEYLFSMQTINLNYNRYKYESLMSRKLDLSAQFSMYVCGISIS